MDIDLKIRLYQAINDAPDERDKSLWHCSSIAKCPRALFYERKGIPALDDNEPGGGKKLRWRGGHALETAIRPELEKLWPDLRTNIRYTDDKLQLTGEYDGYSELEKKLVSVKSVHDYAFVTVDGVSSLKESIGKKISPKTGKEINIWGLKAEPYIHHQWQEHAYIALDEFPVESISYVYITLGGLMACFTTEVKSHITERVTKKLEYLNKCWADDTVPVCLCQEEQEMFKAQDQYCPYKSDKGCCSEELYVK